jgi:hypothetical protein
MEEARKKTMSLCDSCGCYKPFTLTARSRVKKGDVCDECRLHPPTKCSVCEFPHRLKGERCENCESEDMVKESEYCVLCYCHYAPSQTRRLKVVSETPPITNEEATQLIKSLQLCDKCLERCCIPYPKKPYDQYARVPERRNVFLERGGGVVGEKRKQEL